MTQDNGDLVQAINVVQGIVICTDGEIVPITNYLDEYGDDCDDMALVVSLVAGPTLGGLWLAIDRTAYDPVQLN